MEDRLWTMNDVCQYLGVSTRTFRRWRAEQITPQALELGAILRWVPEQVREWALGYVEQGDVFVAGPRADAVTDLRAHSSKDVRR